MFSELLNPVNAFEVLREYLEAGGPVVLALLISTLVLWLLISERFIYYFLTAPRYCRSQVQRWQDRSDRSSWGAHMYRERLVSEVQVENERNLSVIKALIMITPLLGLLGTVTGMIEVFQVITDTGASNARLMAAGISRATIPTMTGLAVSLTGVFAMSYIDRRNDKVTTAISEDLSVDTAMGLGSSRRLANEDMDDAEVDITPLLDIVFILLIFFIVTTTFLDEAGLSLQSPQDNPPDEPTRPPPTLLLSVQTDGFVRVDDARTIDPRSVKSVIEAFKAEEPRGVVLLNAAPESEVSTTVLVLDQARQAGVDPAIAIQGAAQ